VFGGFEAVLAWKLVGRTKTTRDKNLKALKPISIDTSGTVSIQFCNIALIGFYIF
jgi:hypothetical protein